MAGPRPNIQAHRQCGLPVPGLAKDKEGYNERAGLLNALAPFMLEDKIAVDAKPALLGRALEAGQPARLRLVSLRGRWRIVSLQGTCRLVSLLA